MLLEKGRAIYDFCKDWRFKLGDCDFAQYESYDDSTWASISVPHDWSICGGFSCDNPSGPRGGYLPMGIAWYRKTFTAPKNSEGKLVELQFDGIFRCATVYINGICLGFRPCGYIPQTYDISKYLYRNGKENVVAVRVDNSDQPGHRYYSGSGIYREVRLVVRNALCIENMHPFVVTESVKNSNAVLNIKTNIKNYSDSEKKFSVLYELFDGDSKLVASCEVSDSKGLSAYSETFLYKKLNISSAKLWSPDSPYLYSLVTTVYTSDCVCDTSIVKVGIRTIEYSEENGFVLNGKKIFMKGVCIHHDNGALGAVSNIHAERRKLEIMREMGCNAVRLSHNPFSDSFLDLCDEMGFLVMDEAFDEWRLPKVIASLNPIDPRYKTLVHNYYMYFDEWHRADIEAMLYRDRNHPSIVMWSIGNEIPEQRQNVFEGNETAMRLAKIVKAVDDTRPITCACCFGQPGCIDSAFTDALDVIGYNYGSPRYENHHEHFPGKPFIGTETTSHTPFKKRGNYDPHMITGRPTREIANDEVLENSDYVRMHSAERDMMRHKASDGVCGMFIWTGIDYLGEPTPHLWPSRSSYFAPVDTCGFKKDSFYYYQSQWSDKPVLHLTGHWNWDGIIDDYVDILAFTNCDSVELFLNGKSQGVLEYDHKTCSHLAWKLPYEKGELKAVGYISGKPCIETVLATTDKAYAIRLSTYKSELKTGTDDVDFITADIVDKNGNIVSIGEYDITFTLDEGIEILGVDNGDPEYIGSLKSNRIPTLSGKALCIIGEQGISGDFAVTAKAKGLKECSVTIKCH